jgi:hypothetical protein
MLECMPEREYDDDCDVCGREMRHCEDPKRHAVSCFRPVDVLEEGDDSCRDFPDLIFAYYARANLSRSEAIVLLALHRYVEMLGFVKGTYADLSDATHYSEIKCRAALRALRRNRVINMESSRDGFYLTVNRFPQTWLVSERAKPGPPRGDDRIPASVQLRAYRRCKFRCVSCGSTDDLTIDHIVPLTRGGTNDLINLQVLCRPCNSRKSNKVPHDHQDLCAA